MNFLPWFYFSFKGRISRSTYWLYYMLPSLIAGVAFAVWSFDQSQSAGGAPSDPLDNLSPLTMALFFVFAYSGFSIQAKRWHDIDQSAWWILISFVPLLGIWAFISNGFFRGTDGENRFGDEADSPPG